MIIIINLSFFRNKNKNPPAYELRFSNDKKLMLYVKHEFNFIFIISYISGPKILINEPKNLYPLGNAW